MCHRKLAHAGLALLTILLASVQVSAVSDPDEQGTSEPLVNVNGEAVTLDDLRLQLDQLHWGMGSGPEQMIQRPDPWAMLERMVNVRLVVQEAKAIGIEEMPEVKEKLEEMKLELLKQQLVRQRLRDITTPDADEVERLYRYLIREVKVESALFRRREDAEEFLRAVGEGQDFPTLARKMFDERKAVDVVSDSPYFKRDELIPGVRTRLGDADVGTVSEPIAVGESFAVVKLVGERFPDDPDAREQAYNEVLRVTQQTELMEYMEQMRKRYADIDQELAESLDFQERGPGLAALKSDSRVVATIKGGEAVTVAELSERVEKKFYHGIEGALERNRVNSEVLGVLNEIVLERATILESKRLDIEETRDYRTARRDQEARLLFVLFTEKVVNPEVEVDQPVLEAYYEQHASEYVTPVYVRIDSLPFNTEPQASAALAMLRDGAEMRWVRENAEGLANPDDVTFRGGLLPISEVPESVRSAIESAVAGDLFLYEDSLGLHYVLAIAAVQQGRQLTLDEVKDHVEKQAALEAQQQTLESWMGELREASEIEYLVDEQKLRVLLGLSSGEGA